MFHGTTLRKSRSLAHNSSFEWQEEIKMDELTDKIEDVLFYVEDA